MSAAHRTAPSERAQAAGRAPGAGPALATAVPDACAATPGGHCITCGDDGIPMRVVRVDEARGLALCESDAGERSSVEVALVAPVQAGDVLLVHAGTALTRLGSAGREPATVGRAPGAEGPG
jgi:hydrogenase maturation factor